MALFGLEMRLKKKWAEILLEEEMLWLQKSRVDLLRFGDRNTEFFHTMTLVRR